MGRVFYSLFFMTGNGYAKQGTSPSTIACEPNVAKSSFPGCYLPLILLCLLMSIISLEEDWGKKVVYE